MFNPSKITATLLLMGAAVPALATETRLTTLRYNAGVEDETLVFSYPGQIAKYNVALVELGSATDVDAYGAAIADIGGMSIGAAFSRTDWLFTSALTQRSNLSSSTGSFTTSAISLFDLYQYAMLDIATAEASRKPKLVRPSRPVELLAGFQTGFGTLGLRLGFADYKSKVSQTDASITNSASSSAQQTQLSIGLHSGGLDLVLTLDPAGYQKLTEDANSQETSTKVKGGATTFDFRWLQSESSSSPYVTAKLVSREFKASGSTAGRDFSSKFSDQFMTLEGGYVAMKDVHGPRFYTGAQFLKNASKGPSITGTGATAAPSYAANDETAKLDTTVLSATMGGEATVMGGFGLMAGMSYVVYGDVVSKDNTTNQDIKVTKSFAETSDDTLWSLGAYYKVDALRIDASYGKEFLYKGPYLISGASTSPLLTKISASYAF